MQNVPSESVQFSTLSFCHCCCMAQNAHPSYLASSNIPIVLIVFFSKNVYPNVEFNRYTLRWKKSCAFFLWHLENHFAYIVCVLKIGITKHDNFYANKVAKGTFLFMNWYIKRTSIFKVKQQKNESRPIQSTKQKNKLFGFGFLYSTSSTWWSVTVTQQGRYQSYRDIS